MKPNERQVVAVKVASPGTHPSHILELRWKNYKSELFVSTRAQMVAFVNGNSGAAFTSVNGYRANLRVVRDWVETVADSTGVDNLLSLPKFN